MSTPISKNTFRPVELMAAFYLSAMLPTFDLSTFSIPGPASATPTSSSSTDTSNTVATPKQPSLPDRRNAFAIRHPKPPKQESPRAEVKTEESLTVKVETEDSPSDVKDEKDEKDVKDVKEEGDAGTVWRMREVEKECNRWQEQCKLLRSTVEQLRHQNAIISSANADLDERHRKLQERHQALRVIANREANQNMQLEGDKQRLQDAYVRQRELVDRLGGESAARFCGWERAKLEISGLKKEVEQLDGEIRALKLRSGGLFPDGLEDSPPPSLPPPNPPSLSPPKPSEHWKDITREDAKRRFSPHLASAVVYNQRRLPLPIQKYPFVRHSPSPPPKLSPRRMNGPEIATSSFYNKNPGSKRKMKEEEMGNDSKKRKV